MGISQVTPVKGRFEAVSANLRRWLKTSIDELVLVDYSCPDKTASKVWELPEARDARVKVVRVGLESAGPFYNHSRARNIGAQAAKYDCLFFVDADTYVLPAFIECIRQSMRDGVDSVVTFNVPRSWEATYRSLPMTWTTDGQLAMRNAALFELNGFDEEVPTWGGESYDLLLRAQQLRFNWLTVEPLPWVQHIPHGDQLRDKFMPERFADNRGTRERVFLKSMRQYAGHRRISPRSQPGRKCGLSAPARDVTLIRGKSVQLLRPGE